ncbi:MAG TPA: SurA N-terminal domain-containing protein [Candidatus Saccharimonadales bacterium]|jgi:hypothetical protein|nr:SurA N-terminal domain-containing protein [Candidatus Saccharimonadales bacterium]
MKHHNIKAKLRVPKLSIPHRKKKTVDERFNEAVRTLPRITTDTVAAHREQILSSARKYIYPLRHSKHRIVSISVSLTVVAVVVFFGYCILALYHFQTDSDFLYEVTQVIPFPVAKAGPSYVSYENYLFELRHYIHYYQTQEQVNFNSNSGRNQLNNYKKQALNEVIQNAYVKQLAAKYHISVSNQEVNNEIDLVRTENRLGNNQKEFADVLNEFWGWSINDFKTELKQQLLAQDVVSRLDTSTHLRAEAALSAIKHGASFATVASQYSDDLSTKGNGGEFGFTIDVSNQTLSPQTLNTILSLGVSQTSGIINLGNSLEIDNVISNNNGQIQAAHILFNFAPIQTYLRPLEAKEKTHIFINQKYS